MKMKFLVLALTLTVSCLASAQEEALFPEISYNYENRQSGHQAVLELRDRKDQSGLSVVAHLVSSNCRIKGIIAQSELKQISELISGSLVTQATKSDSLEETSGLRILTPENRTQEFYLGPSQKDRGLRLSKETQIKARLNSIVSVMKQVGGCL